MKNENEVCYVVDQDFQVKIVGTPGLYRGIIVKDNEIICDISLVDFTNMAEAKNAMNEYVCDYTKN